MNLKSLDLYESIELDSLDSYESAKQTRRESKLLGLRKSIRKKYIEFYEM